MPTSSEFTLDIAPLPCPRPRIVVRGRFPSAYYPKSYTEWKKQALSLLGVRHTAFSGPLYLRAAFVVERPKTTKLSHPKPDLDNYLKSLMDALTAANWWEDDSQVVQVHASKRWSTPTEHPHINFSIYET